MRAVLAISVLCNLILLPSPAAAFSVIAPDLRDARYYRCGTAEDCAVAHTPCGGFAAVRKEHLEELQDWFDYQGQMVRCRQPPPDRPRVRALLCTENRCELEMTAPAK